MSWIALAKATASGGVAAAGVTAADGLASAEGVDAPLDRQQMQWRRLEHRAWGEIVGALLVDNSLIPILRARLESCGGSEACVDDAIGLVLATALAVYDGDEEGEETIDASRVMTELADDPARDMAERLESYALRADSPRAMSEGALGTLTRVANERRRRIELERAAGGERELLEAANRELQRARGGDG